jgi:hypothetical protein
MPTRHAAPRRPPPGAALLAAAGALALAAGTAAAAPSPAEALRGTYRLAGSARVDAGPALSRNVEARADAVLTPGRGPRAVRARLLAEGRACELEATLGEGGALAFEPGQRCTFDVADPDARGHVEARLRAGKGRCEGGKLSLDLTFALEGALALRTAQRVEVMGSTVELPATWTPELPLRGDAHAVAEGKRDESRAGGR